MSSHREHGLSYLLAVNGQGLYGAMFHVCIKSQLINGGNHWEKKEKIELITPNSVKQVLWSTYSTSPPWAVCMQELQIKKGKRSDSLDPGPPVHS